MEGGERNHEREEGVSGTHLGVLFAHVSEQVMDELVDESLWGVDASDDLRDHLEPGSDLPTDGRLQEPKSNEEGGGQDDPSAHARAQQCPGTAGHHGVQGTHQSSHPLARAVA